MMISKIKIHMLILILIWGIYSLSFSAISGLSVHILNIPNLTTDSSSRSYSFQMEMMNQVSEVFETMLYSVDGKEKAYEEGRRIFKDYRNGTITVVDTKDNLRKVSEYMDQLNDVIRENSGSMYVRPKSRIFNIRHADPNNIRNLINQIIQESRIYSGGGGSGSNYVTGIITLGAGNGLSYLGVTVELIDIIGQDTSNAQARLYIYTSYRDREVTLSRGNSDLIDNYRVRLVSVDPRREEAEIEIRLVGNLLYR